VPVERYTLGEVFQQMGIRSDDAELCARTGARRRAGAPGRGFRPCATASAQWDSSWPIGDGFIVTTSRDVLEAMAAWRWAPGT
jgi:hypothetical protein